MKKIIFLLFVALIAGIYGTKAQDKAFGIMYSIGFPSGNLSDYIEKTSFRGATAEFFVRTKKTFGIGLEVGWNTFYEKVDDRVYTEGTASLSGIQYRYTNSVPLLASFKYFKESSGSKVMPFAGLGIGTVYTQRSTDIGLYRINTNVWQFALRPEIGLIYRVSPGVGLTAVGKYYSAFDSDELDGQSFFAFQVGFVFATDH